MTEEQYLQLIHREIDGENSAEESAALKSCLEENPQAKKAFDELRAVASKLEQAEMLEPPAQLKTAIMNALPKQKYAPKTSPGLLQKLSAVLPRQPRFQVGFAFAGGLAVGLLLFALLTSGDFSQHQPDPAQLYGTLADAGENAHVMTVELGDTYGTAAVRIADASVIVVLDFEAVAATGMSFEFDAEQLAFGGILSDGAAPVNIRISPAILTLQPRQRLRARLIFTRLEQSLPAFLHFKISQNDTVRYQINLLSVQ